MTLTLVETKVPLRLTEQGQYRVEGTRIPLDTIVHEFQSGNSPEEIITHFDTLQLADVYQIIAFYLYNKDSVDEYLKDQERAAEKVKSQLIEKGFAVEFDRQNYLEQINNKKALLNH